MQNITLNLKSDTLLIIPCSGKKQGEGMTLDNYDDVLKEFVAPEIYYSIISVRKNLLETIKQKQKYVSNKCSKNKNIKYGADFGLHDLSGKYLPAIDRYTGKLYSEVPNFSELIKNGLDSPDKPRIIILSALYGPLHPLSMIQDYNLKMSDSPAYQTWKKYFPTFIKQYIQQNNINKIHLYFGSSTSYFKVAHKAINPMLKKGLINQAIQFEVEDGNSYHTPINHGLLVFAHYQNENVSGFTKNIKGNLL